MTMLLSNRMGRLCACLGISLLCTLGATAQQTTPEPLENLDDITTRAVVKEHDVLAYAPVREADILWEKRIWRVLDVREKINQPFAAWESPLFKILMDAALSGELTVYGTDTDQFKTKLSQEDLEQMLFKTDTISTMCFGEGTDDWGEPAVQIVRNETNWEDVKRFRIKEVWYFDTRTSSLQVRILGIAPLIDVLDNEGNFRFEKPLFWVHYPSARPLLAKQNAITHNGNASDRLSWEDVFERRQFSASIMKENNLHDRRIAEYASGIEALQESRRIESALFSREHDSWTW